jgi:hypothetical protein
MTCENVNYLTRRRIRDDKDERITSVISGQKTQHPGCGMFKPMIGKKRLKSPLQEGRNLIKTPCGPPRMCNQVHNFSYVSRDFGT